MQASTNNGQEFEDLKSHSQMWAAFTGFVFKGTVAAVVLLVLIGWITGVL